jgi:hypothetical protein
VEKCDFKVDIPKQEIDLLARKIDHFDDLRQRTKQMAATLWVAAVGTALARLSEPLLLACVVYPSSVLVF